MQEIEHVNDPETIHRLLAALKAKSKRAEEERNRIPQTAQATAQHKFTIPATQEVMTVDSSGNYMFQNLNNCDFNHYYPGQKYVDTLMSN